MSFATVTVAVPLNLSTDGTGFATISKLNLDQSFFSYSTNTIGAAFLSLKNMGGITSAPNQILYTSGSNALYTPSNGVSMTVVDACAQGGGGGAQLVNFGTNGSSTTWIGPDGSTTSANGGLGGGFYLNNQVGLGGTGGQGGSMVSSSSSVFQSAGLSGNNGGQQGGSNQYMGGGGGSSGFGGGGGGAAVTTANNAVANSGGGGSGGGSYANGGGSGGGGGECFHLVINSPSSSGYRYTVGSIGGQGGVAGTQAGGNGGSGFIHITEYYGTQGFAAPASSYTVIPGTIFTQQSATSLAVTTVTLTTSGAPLYVVVNGAMFNTSTQDQCWSILIDGDFPTILGVKGTATTCYGGGSLLTGSRCQNVSGATPPITGLAAGVHNIALIPRGTAATNNNFVNDTSCGDGLAIHSTFGVEERKNAIGTGDVSSNGTNVLSGALTATGATTLSTTTLTGYFSPRQMTLAQAVAATPTVGAVVSCSNCTNPYTLLVGTGTAVDQWREQGLTTGAK
jgi:hypothetical protein